MKFLTKQSRLNRTGACAPLALAAVLAIPGIAQAVPIASITSDLSITGSLTYDTGFSFVDNAQQSGTMAATVGGASTTSNYSASCPAPCAAPVPGLPGTNPLNAVFTDTGDGLRITGTASDAFNAQPGFDAEFTIGIDLVMQLSNSSLTDVLQVTLSTTYSQAVDASGADAYVDSNFSLFSRLSTDPAPGVERTFTHLVTDTLFGNEVNGSDVAGFGGPLSDSGSDTLVLNINPGESYVIEGDWTMEGGGYNDPLTGVQGFASLDSFDVFVGIDSIVVRTPAPTVLALLGIGLLGIIGINRRRAAA